MNSNETLPDIPEGYRQLDSVDFLQEGDMVFGRFNETWHPVKAGSVNIGNSAGNTRIVVRKIGVADDPQVRKERKAAMRKLTFQRERNDVGGGYGRADY